MFPPPFPSAPRRPRGTCALLCEHTPWQLRCTPTVGSRAEVQVESEQTCGWNQVGQPIDENLAMQDPITGEQLVGVGIFFQQVSPAMSSSPPSTVRSCVRLDPLR